jgi:ubiquinone/menaquinone biosynthesis C-methylase UbiE
MLAEKHEEVSMCDKPIAAGKSSFDLIDAALLVALLEIEAGITFLDVACGAGAYTLALADPIGPDGRLFAVDLWQEGIEKLTTEAHARKVHTLEAHVADVSRRMPLASDTVDLCLMATVLHDLIEDQTDQGTLEEVARVIRPGGRLAVIEFNKIDGPPGPPRAVRLSPEETETCLRPHGFKLMATHEIGPFNYVSLFSLDN